VSFNSSFKNSLSQRSRLITKGGNVGGSVIGDIVGVFVGDLLGILVGFADTSFPLP